MRDDRQSWIAATILILAAGLFFGRLGERGITSEEMRWAEVAREMRLSGDYFHPTINGRTYYDKPLGSYWLIVAASYVTGGVNETAARLPAAVAGWVGVWLTMRLGRRLYDCRVGLLAGAILATSFGFVFYARRATADAETVTGVLAAVWLYARNIDRPGAWIVGLWAIMAATSLTKGLLGFALPVCVFVIHSGWMGRDEARSWRGAIHGQRWLWNGWSLIAIPLAAGIFLTPFAISMSRMGSNDGIEMLVRENIRRFFSPHNHTGPFYLYAEVIFLLLAPWSLFLPAALWPVKKRTKGDMLACVYFWAIFAFFTASASRRNYYLLPILPAASLLVARTLLSDQLAGWAARLRQLGQWLMVAIVALAGVLLLSPADVLPAPWDALPPLPGRAAFAVGWLGLLALTVVAMMRSRLAIAATATAAAAMGFAFLVAIPGYGQTRSRQTFVAEVRANAAPGSLALYHARDVVYELASPTVVAEYRDAAALERDLREGRIVWVIARRRAIRDVALSASIVLEEIAPPWEEQAGDRLVLLRAHREVRR